ncbi:MAG TPA: hypothetical protein VFV67_02740 [Actinophytocola sp.]|uniref:hypothetical protein n=1 Tax=Actinophytocola sp. TaxID=1872138 RepID=UPI002DBD05A8|nr:hypothetical protein [Actinophytocola sp.]HEU5469544.1 hypothetical protein [Actinophytocola sp.]
MPGRPRPVRPWVPRPRSDTLPDLLPRAGHDLITGIDSVLDRLGSVPDRQLADDLKAALARTAACGDTCRVRTAADAVRAAADLLVAGSVDRARLVLIEARAGLSGPGHNA